MRHDSAAMPSSAFTAGSIRLRGGRRLAFAEHGPCDGAAVLYLHGAIGSPLGVADELAAVIERLSLRWICVERPGFGASDPAPGRSMLDFAADVGELLDALGLRRVTVIGVSAGGPYALACAHRLAGRVGAVAVCSSVSPLGAPHEVPGLPPRIRLPLALLAARPRWCTRALEHAARLARRHPGLVRRALRIGATAGDGGPRARPVAGGDALDGLLATLDGGVPGLVEDYLISCRPWGFSPADVRTPVCLWHGMQDRIVPVEHAWQLAAALPSCRAAFDPDEGHFFFRRRVGEIAEAVVAAAAVSRG